MFAEIFRWIALGLVSVVAAIAFFTIGRALRDELFRQNKDADEDMDALRRDCDYWQRRYEELRDKTNRAGLTALPNDQGYFTRHRKFDTCPFHFACCCDYRLRPRAEGLSLSGAYIRES